MSCRIIQHAEIRQKLHRALDRLGNTAGHAALPRTFRRLLHAMEGFLVCRMCYSKYWRLAGIDWWLSTQEVFDLMEHAFLEVCVSSHLRKQAALCSNLESIAAPIDQASLTGPQFRRRLPSWEAPLYLSPTKTRAAQMPDRGR